MNIKLKGIEKERYLKDIWDSGLETKLPVNIINGYKLLFSRPYTYNKDDFYFTTQV